MHCLQAYIVIGSDMTRQVAEALVCSLFTLSVATGYPWGVLALDCTWQVSGYPLAC